MLRRLLAPPAVLSLGLISACAWVDADEIAEDNALVLSATFPADGAVAVDPRTEIDLCFSTRLDPRSIGPFDAVLSSGLTVFDVEATLQLFPWRPPGGLGALPEAPWCEGSVLSLRPRGTLRAGAIYRVRLRPSAVGWAGETLDLEDAAWTELDDGGFAAYIEITIAGDPGDDPPPEDLPGPPTSLRDLYAEGGPLDPARGLCSCHRQPYGLANERLDLRSPEAAFAALVLEQTPRSTGYPMITPRQPSESFLIHKLLRDPAGEPLHGVLGSAMPLPGPLPYADMAAIARWIEDGALL